MIFNYYNANILLKSIGIKVYDKNVIYKYLDGSSAGKNVHKAVASGI